MRLMVVAARGGQLTRAAKLAERSGAEIICANGVSEATDLLSINDRVDIVLIDVALPIKDLEKKLKENRRALPVIACGASTDVAIAQGAIDAGAIEYLPTPADIYDLAALIEALALDDDVIFYGATKASLH
jgi:DNA-binding NtrC family response regulator